LQMQRTSRKNEHVQYAVQTGQNGQQGFAEVKFVHNCIPQSKYSDISLQTTFGGLQLSSPIIINAMTGGAEETLKINERLAWVAREAKLAMAVGSQMAAIKDPSVKHTYDVVRQVNPNGILFANLGSEATVDHAQQAVEMIQADALQIHLNVMQELIMPEGDRDFNGVLERIAAIVEALPCPVFIKEVGFGISQEAAKQLIQAGISGMDVGGRGGTNFAAIENQRRVVPLAMLEDWGMTTVQSLLEVYSLNQCVNIMATGGLQNGLDITKSLALGASAVGMAGFFLRLATMHSEQEMLAAVLELHEQIILIMTALGARSIAQIQNCPVVISGDSFHWATMRGIDCKALAQR
jgi:isopentenyl-diphosphate delta-isomerase